MTPQELLFDAHKRGITLFRKAGDRLGFKPVRLCPPEFREQLLEHKAELLTLLADLEQHGAQADPLILEALALFNGTFGPRETDTGSPLAPPRISCSASEVARGTEVPPMPEQTTFLEKMR
jgi:hypothetical protein